MGEIERNYHDFRGARNGTARFSFVQAIEHIYDNIIYIYTKYAKMVRLCRRGQRTIALEIWYFNKRLFGSFQMHLVSVNHDQWETRCTNNVYSLGEGRSVCCYTCIMLFFHSLSLLPPTRCLSASYPLLQSESHSFTLKTQISISSWRKFLLALWSGLPFGYI